MERLKLHLYADVQIVENFELQGDEYLYSKSNTGYIKIGPGSTLIVGYQSGTFETQKHTVPQIDSFPYKYELEMFTPSVAIDESDAEKEQKGKSSTQIQGSQTQQAKNQQKPFTNCQRDNQTILKHAQQNNFQITNSNKGINLKQLWNKKTNFIPCELISTLKISKVKQKVKRGASETDSVDCLFIDFESGGVGKLKQMLLILQTFKQDNQNIAKMLGSLIENIEFRRLMIAAARATLLNSLALYRGMECNEVDFKSKKQQQIQLNKIIRQFEGLLKSRGVSQDKCIELLGDTEPSKIIWRRIGFQSSSPQSDFRASGSLGLLAIIYAAFTVPNFLLNGSFAEMLKTNSDIEKYLKTAGEGTYQYPVSVSIINVTHKILSQQQFIQEKANQLRSKSQSGHMKLKQHVFQQIQPNDDILLSLLSNEYIGEWIVVLNNIDNIIQAITSEIEATDNKSEYLINVNSLIGIDNENESDGHRQKWLQEYKDQLLQIKELYNDSNKQIDKLCQTIIKTPSSDTQLVPSKPIWLASNAQLLSSISPNLGGQLLKLIISLSLALGERLSHFEHTQQYLNYPSQFDVFISDFLAALKSKDVYCIDDLVYKMRYHWQ